MPMRWMPGLIAVAALSMPVSAAGQGLAELAEKEKKRQQAADGKVFTSSDLRKAGGGRRTTPAQASPAPAVDGEAADGASGDAASAADPAEPEKTPYEQRQEAAGAWREQLNAAREESTRLEGEVEEIQASLNDLSVGFFTASRTRREAQLEQAKADLEAARQEVSRLQTEGRRSGYR